MKIPKQFEHGLEDPMSLLPTPSKGQPDRPDYTTKWFEDGFYWSHGGIEWNKCDPQPYKEQPTYKKSLKVGDKSSLGQPSVDEVLKPYHDHSCHSTQAWLKGQSKPFPCDCSINEAKAALLELFMACKPETYKKDQLPEGFSVDDIAKTAEYVGFNAALNLWESNLKQRMEKE